MKTNIGRIDKIIRIIIAIVVTILYFTDVITGTFGITVLAIAGVLLFTSFIGFCPFYTMFGIGTCAKDK